ncbi:hypothetical protein BC834DRAFT_246868 [Gloeopeniophorella convolvens]|nr:hypothetical protein BC834DRAFT_246868 [Gloeopeniophorella convolvens]
MMFGLGRPWPHVYIRGIPSMLRRGLRSVLCPSQVIASGARIDDFETDASLRRRYAEAVPRVRTPALCCRRCADHFGCRDNLQYSEHPTGAHPYVPIIYVSDPSPPSPLHLKPMFRMCDSAVLLRNLSNEGDYACHYMSTVPGVAAPRVRTWPAEALPLVP